MTGAGESLPPRLFALLAGAATRHRRASKPRARLVIPNVRAEDKLIVVEVAK